MELAWINGYVFSSNDLNLMSCLNEYQQQKHKMNKQQEDNLSWILNIVENVRDYDLEAKNMRSIAQEQLLALKTNEELQSGIIYTYSHQHQQFIKNKFSLLPNILLMFQNNEQSQEDPYFLMLSNCSISKKNINYKQISIFGVLLTNQQGSTYLYFQYFVQFRNWYKTLKSFCKLEGFLNKYRLADKLLPGFYNCVKKKTKKNYTVQIYKLEDFIACPELEEAIHNEIHILRSIKHQSLLDLKRVFQNTKYLFIVYEYYQGQSLIKLMQSTPQMHEIQIASMMYQIIQVLKFLSQHEFYHGSINAQNILIDTQQPTLQIVLVNLSFKEYKLQDKLDWILNRSPETFLAPEIFNGIAPNISSDIYSVGTVLFFLEFFQPDRKIDEKDFFPYMEYFQPNIKVIEEQEQKLKKYPQQKEQYSSSSLDLMKQLLQQDPQKRITLKEASKHHWFLNVKEKLKSLKKERKRKKPLPSLRTIIELREQSEMDVKSYQMIGHDRNRGTSIFQRPQKPTILIQREFNDIEEDNIPEDDHELNLKVQNFQVFKSK